MPHHVSLRSLFQNLLFHVGTSSQDIVFQPPLGTNARRIWLAIEKGGPVWRQELALMLRYEDAVAASLTFMWIASR